MNITYLLLISQCTNTALRLVMFTTSHFANVRDFL